MSDELPIDRPLRVLDAGAAFLVAPDGDEDEWLARFEKAPGFAAREWADNMARVYNRRLSGRGPDPRMAPPPAPDARHARA